MNEQQEKTPHASKVSDNQIITTENQLVNDYDIDAYLTKRSEFITKVNKIMVEGKDFHLIQGRKSMAKGGAEKIAAIFGWQAMFLPDDDTIKMLGTEKGVVAYICRLQKGSHFVGEGRGARSLAQDKGDVNKAIKMASKSAFVDAVLRSSGLSDFYTQDLENMTPEAHQTQNPAITDEQFFKVSGSPSGLPATLKQKNFIKVLMKACHIEKLSEAVFEEKEMTVTYAKEIIDKLIKLKDEPKEEELPTINIE